MSKIRILHIGGDEWASRYTIPEELELTEFNVFPQRQETVTISEDISEEMLGEGESLEAVKAVLEDDKDADGLEKHYELIFVDRDLNEVECERVHSLVDAYRLYVMAPVEQGAALKQLVKRLMAETMQENQIQDFLSNEARFFFKKPYGEKFNLEDLAISPTYKGEVIREGSYSVELDGDFGQDFHQVLYFIRPIPIASKQVLDFWVEYEKTDDVEVKVKISSYPRAISTVIQPLVREYTEQALQKQILLENEDHIEHYFFVSIELKGSGSFKMIALHTRYSRGKHGFFLPGGKQYVSSKKEELFYYFDPGDLKPPLNVYFSGYKTQQGFEGYFIMKNTGAPFLLIAEPRLEGGSFYLGDEEYETAVADIIIEHMNWLGFSKKDMIFAGLSMGTTGALYYGSKLEPYAIVVGKPLMNLGTIAENERLHRPHVWGTSLDILKFLSGGRDQEHIASLNQKLWDAFDQANFDNTKLVIAYMQDDDYDRKAYEMILTHVYGAGVEVYGKGLPGRHNDNTGGIAQWFLSQFHQLLDVDFKRGLAETKDDEVENISEGRETRE